MSQTLDRAIDGYTNSFPNFTLIYSSPDKHLDDLPAYLIEGQYSDHRIWRTEILEIGTLKDGINYFIQYFANLSQDDVSIFQDMIDSFDIQNTSEKVQSNVTS